MSDLVTRLILDNKQFNDNIARSKREVEQYNNIQSTITSTLSKFAGGLGLAMTAGQAFNKVLNSSQTLSDLTASAMQAAKTGVDEFFYSLGSGDFTSFLNGLDDIITKSQDAYNALDQLGNTRISFNYYTGKFDEAIAQARLTAKNKQLDENERRKAFAAWDIELKKKEEAGTTVANDALNALTKSIVVGTKLRASDISLNDFEKVMKIDLMPSTTRDEAKNFYKQQYNDYLKLSKRIEKDRVIDVTKAGNNYSRIQDANNAARIAQEGAAAKYKDAVMYNKLLNKLSDEDLKKLTELGKEYYATSQLIAQQRQEFNESTTEFSNSIVTAETAAKAAAQKAAKEAANAIPTGSIAELDKMISEAKKKYNNAITDAARVEALKLIKELEQRKVVLNITAKFNSRDLDELKLPALKTEDFDTSKLKLKPIISKKDISLNQDYASSINDVTSAFSTMGNTMSTISSLTQDGADTWFNYSISLMSAVANAIPAITALTTAKKAEANANLEAAATGAASSVASIPFVGWAMAVSAIAAIIAAATNIPKLKNGGIAFGNSIVNVGEYAGARSNPEIIAPLSKLKEYISPKESNTIAGDVTFKIKGQELIGVLNNYNKKTNKIK
ncbi:hypothetical protein BOVA604_1994 [Bacteroides ovatus]|uniref:hypothetical protein n=1 Tax=Bacteroides ovatus TaxID=28116 RepID=UPI0020A75EAF|nr:hypothetical protein [Bacteroides ovatus]CAG9894041.1 hypothetical protein BOVA604_1994 [Bacteroides ovatus]